MFFVFSPNMLKTFETCPKKFDFKYNQSVNMPVNDTIFESGKNIHAIASYFLNGNDINKFENILTSKESEMWNFLKSIKYFSYELVNTEYNLNVKKGDYTFGGRLDALFKNNDCYYILDYKTGKIPKNSKYDFQTMIYLLAVRDYFQTTNVKFVYVDLKNKTEEIIELTEELKEEYEKILIDIARRINKHDYSLSKTKNYCDCEYKLICRGGGGKYISW